MASEIYVFKKQFSSQQYFRIGVSVFFFIQGITYASWASRIPDIKTALKLSDAGLGGLLLALPIGSMLSLPIAAFLVSHFGSKKIAIVCAFCYPLLLVCIGLPTNVFVLAPILLLFGLAGNVCNIAINTQAVGVEILYRKSIIASFHGLWSLAGFAGGLLSTLMVAKAIVPFTHFCFVFVGCMVMLFAFSKFILPRDRGHGIKQPIFVKPGKEILVLGLIALSSMICEGTMFDWGGVYYKTIIKVKPELLTLGYVCFMATMASGRFAADWFTNKYGVRPLLVASGCLIFIGLGTAVLLPTLVFATIGFFITGFGVSSVVPIVYALAGKSKTMLPGPALAAVSSVGFLGFLVGPPLIGFISEASSLRWAFAVMAVLGAAVAVMGRRL